MILAVNIWDGDVRMGVIEEIRLRINKIRWERWRAKQNKELEKSYCYAWGESWSDVPLGEDPIKHWEDKHSCAMGSIDNPYWGYLAISVGYFGYTWIDVPNRHCYEYNMRIVGVGRTKKDASTTVPYCTSHFVEIKQTVNPDAQTVWQTFEDKYVGAWPHTGATVDYYQIAGACASYAIDLMSSFAGFELSTIEFINSLLSAVDESEHTEEIVRREWDCPYLETSDCGHFFWWLHDVDPNPDPPIQFTVEDFLYGLSGESQPLSIKFTFSITPPNDPTKLSAAELRKYGIQKIPIREIKERAAELGISSTTVKELIEQGEPVYIGYEPAPSLVAIHLYPEPSTKKSHENERKRNT